MVLIVKRYCSSKTSIMKSASLIKLSSILLFALFSLHCNSSKELSSNDRNQQQQYGTIKFEKSQFKNALATAKQENKVIFVDVYARWCGPCKVMEKEVFTDAEVATVYNENFINIKIDGDRPEGNAFMKKYDIRSYPSYLFIDASGEVIDRRSGMMSSPQFKRWGKKIGKKSLN